MKIRSELVVVPHFDHTFDSATHNATTYTGAICVLLHHDEVAEVLVLNTYGDTIRYTRDGE